MALKNTLSLSVGCSNCRLAILRAFTSFSGLLLRKPISHYTAPRNATFSTSRTFLTSRTWRSESFAQIEIPNSEPVDGRTDFVEEHEEIQASSSQTPWYLRVETPQRISNPLLERQRIPELPSNPPPLLQPILEHISVNLGLDDLTILDLRHVDPPPALGANLLMILGTARSEKHLHVSADRFCRWLKVTHQLSPYADGLLGKGELKLKLRRKARRARLLSNVGSSDTGHSDDGIRTGWICVNVGTIEDGKDSVKDFVEHEGYIGFGSEAGGARVVVQMLVQEKREELDLEDLWGKVLRRHERKGEKASIEQEKPLTNQEVT